MPTINLMSSKPPDTPPPAWGPGWGSQEKAGGPTAARDAWMAVLQSMAAPHGDGSARKTPPSADAATSAASLPAANEKMQANRPGPDGQAQQIKGEREGLVPLSGTWEGLSKYLSGAPGRPSQSGNPGQPDPAPQAAARNTGDIKGAGVHGGAPVRVPEETALPGIPGQEADIGMALPNRPAPLEKHTDQSTTPGNGSPGPLSPEEEPTAARVETSAQGVQPPATASTPGVSGHVAADRPHGPVPSPGVPQPVPAPPSMPGQTVPEVAGLQLDQPAKASPAAGLTAAVRPDDLAMPRERPAGSPSQHPASLKALSDIKPPETERPLAGRQAIGPPQAAPPANALETDRPAPVNGHAQRSPFAGQTATPASTAADASWTGTAPIRNEPAVLRLEHPFWAAAGSGEPVANEARLILPTDAPPPATREMRLLGDIIEKAYWHQENGRAQARIQIKPDFLGHLQLDVQTHQSKVSVEIRVETLLAREFIETNLQGLKTNLQESGLDIDRIDVIVDSGGDNPRDQHREPARKHGRQPGTLAEMTENTRPGNHENPNRLLSTGGAQNSINTFA